MIAKIKEFIVIYSEFITVGVTFMIGFATGAVVL
jgi:hypothetical protein